MNDIKAKFYKALTIDKSNIGGYGLFAGEKIVKGEYVLSFGGVLAPISERQSDKYIPSTFAGITDLIMICEGNDSEKDYSDYINHSCSPNIGMDDCLTMVAIRDIEAGEELTCDYAFWEADENWVLRCDCNCGSPECRMHITGRDWRLFTVNSPSFMYFSPFIRRRILSNGNGE